MRLSRSELEKLVLAQKKELDALKNPPPNDWHSWFYSLLMITFHKFPSINVEREVVLGAQPPRADFVVVREDGIVDLGLKIFQNFRKYNILEFKNPNDELSESVLWKLIGYAGFYIAKYNIPAEDVTLTMFRSAKPEKLLRDLGSSVAADDSPGIFYVKNWKACFPIQIIVTAELDGKEYAGFRAVSKKPRIQDIQQMMQEALQERDPDRIGWYRDFLYLFSRLDNEMLQEAKRRFPEMAKTWMDIFKPEIDAQMNAVRRNDLFRFVQKGKMSLHDAADEADLTLEQFKAEFEHYKMEHENLQPA